MRLRVLLIEDAAADAELITRELKASGLSFALTRVETEQDFRQELTAHPPDLVLSDHGLPQFSGFRALEIVHEEFPELPFIFVSGSNDPNMVAHMYEVGATDYVFKHDLGDLKTAVLHALAARAGHWLPPGDHDPPPEQTELALQLPESNSGIPIITPGVGHLSFCPQCRKVRDDAGQEIELTDYCSRCAEILVQRAVCTDCERRARSN